MSARMYYTLSEGSPARPRKQSVARGIVRLFIVLLVAASLVYLGTPALVIWFDSLILPVEAASPAETSTLSAAPADPAVEVAAPTLAPTLPPPPTPAPTPEVAVPPMGALHLQPRVAPPAAMIIREAPLGAGAVLPTVTPSVQAVLPTVTPQGGAQP